MGSRVGDRYRVDGVLAEGGMGAVYRVFDERTGETLALKRMRRPESRSALAMFEREYRTLLGIRHPRIIRVFEYGVDPQGPFYTMDLVRGRDLSELAPVPFAQACRYLRDVATSLALLHTRRLLHRDIAPRNVRVTPDERCMLLDFGALASFGTAEHTVGTPPCIAPEALRGAPLDQRADLFSFGALAYWMLTGRHAFPARCIADLPRAWRTAPARPSALQSSVPRDADALVLSLLRLDPMLRPGSMAEVAERLNLIGALEPEDDVTSQALAASYLVHTQFVGRERELGALRAQMNELQRGRGGPVLVEAERGVGRTRLLDELVVHAKLMGLATVYLDASIHAQPHAVGIAFVHALLDASPEAAQAAEAHAQLLQCLDPSLADRLGGALADSRPTPPADWVLRCRDALCSIIAETCRAHPLLVVIDNADEADETWLPFLVALQRLGYGAALAVVCSARQGEGQQPSEATLLRGRGTRITLAALSASEMLELSRSIFGDAPHAVRFTEWCYELTRGRPLLFLDLVRQLYGEGVVRYLDGLWVLPAERPQATLPLGFREALGRRLDALSPKARALAETIAAHRNSLSREHGVALAAKESRHPYALLDDLLAADVLQQGAEGYRLSHDLLREILLDGLDAERRRQLHLRCADQMLEGELVDDRMLARVEAGWHLLQAGEEQRGADLIARVAYRHTLRMDKLDLHLAGPAFERALEVYERRAGSSYELVSLLTALTRAGFYAERIWAERHGERAIAMLEELTGLDLARKLERWLGPLGVLIGIFVAWARFVMTARRSRPHPFASLFVQLFVAVIATTVPAILALDVTRADRVTRKLAPFVRWVPKYLVPAGVFEFCLALTEVGRENQGYALRTWSRLLERVDHPFYYAGLPKQARKELVDGLWFARGVFAGFRDGRGALQAAAELDKSEHTLFRMIASELRMLHYAYRGELDEARRHREHVELYAMQAGSAWQVELWEPCALILAYTTIGDLVEMKRIADRIRTLARTAPSLKLYLSLSEIALEMVRLDRPDLELRDLSRMDGLDAIIAHVERILETHAPRSFIGWGAVHGYLARALNRLGRHEQARVWCQRALSELTEEDREFVVLFLNVEIELAVAEAGLGHCERAMAQLDALLACHQASTNPLTHGLLHEAYARVAAMAADWERFHHHLAETRIWFGATRNPVLIARLQLLTALERRPATAAHAALGSDADAEADVPTQMEMAASGERAAADTASSERQTTAAVSRSSIPSTSGANEP